MLRYACAGASTLVPHTLRCRAAACLQKGQRWGASSGGPSSRLWPLHLHPAHLQPVERLEHVCLVLHGPPVELAGRVPPPHAPGCHQRPSSLQPRLLLIHRQCMPGLHDWEGWTGGRC